MARQRIRELDGVRALAILSVFAHHSLGIKLLWMGVDLFFVLSGFLITGVLLETKRHSLGHFFSHFYSRRVRRIMVPYVIFLAVATLVLGAGWMRYWYFYILATNFLHPLGITQPAGLQPLWSLAVEEQFYLLWPFAVYFLNERHLKKLCLFLIVLAPVLRGVFHFHTHWPIYMLTPFRMDLLAAGAYICLEWRERQEAVVKVCKRFGLPLAGFGVIGMLLISHFGYTTYENSRTGNVCIYEACLFIACGVILYALSGKAAWLGNKVLTYIGVISYSMYLIHNLVLSFIMPRIAGVAGAGLALAITIAYAALSWHLVESRLLKTNRTPAKDRGIQSA